MDFLFLDNHRASLEHIFLRNCLRGYLVPNKENKERKSAAQDLGINPSHFLLQFPTATSLCLISPPWGAGEGFLHNKSFTSTAVLSLERTMLKEEWEFPGGAVDKNLSANAGDMSSIPGPERSHVPWSN